MAIENMLLKLQDHNREIYLFDTFDGMTPPTDKDVSYMGVPASATLSKQEKSDQDSLWNYVSLKAVKKAVLSVGYNKKKIHFIKGKVEDTLPSKAPKTISLLRLDTDWYESTRHELATLFPRISTSGVLIVDDYGHWKGARHAMDEYIKEKKIKIMLNRIDYTGRIGIVLH